MVETSKAVSVNRQELINAITHGLGLLFSLISVPILIGLSLPTSEWYEVAGLAVFCFSMLLVYLTSTLYHSITQPAVKHAFQVIDHISIYFLIAGTHTPLLIYYLNNPTGYFYLALLWSLVLIGILYKLFFFNRLKILSVLFYLGMGWMAVFTLPPMLNQMSDLCLLWIMIGGASYSLGVIFYLWKLVPYHHAIWHLFVMGGTTGHFIAMIYAIPAG